MSNVEQLGPISKLAKRKEGWKDNAGVKDRAGRSINLTYLDGKLFTPWGEEHVRNVKRAKIRPDDVIICGYAKTGCHWMYEILSMVVKGKAEYSNRLKLLAMLELAAPEIYDAIPSPRILNTHVEYDWLADQARQMKTKLVLTVRNPKDTAVSLYNHHLNLKEIYNYDGEFNDWFELFKDGKVDNGSYFDYYVSWEKAINENPDHPILVVKYEESKKNIAKTVRTVANFLNVPLTEEQVAQMAKAAEFGSMRNRFKGEITEGLMRKGDVGDWKNWLTEEQAKELDKMSKLYLSGTRFETSDEI